MKAIVIERTVKNLGWYFVADSAVSNTGKPFYLPDTSGETAVSLSLAVRINRLGKAVSSKFAHRYYSEVAPALHFVLPELRKRLREEYLPQDPSRSFDRSLMVGEARPFSPGEGVVLKLNGEPVTNVRITDPGEVVDKRLETVSQLNTIKMGDLFLPVMSREIPLKEGDFLEVEWQSGEKAFQVKIK